MRPRSDKDAAGRCERSLVSALLSCLRVVPDMETGRWTNKRDLSACT
jgi:hypothetical protein